ncbi:hypothetical protein KR222_011847 [Zaprionus bogoriensis]|nr:hypothetical protein KR222_011847 [Zaprionus bogoriensis]
MDLSNTENRLIVLECLRENATNMRIEHQEIRERIATAIVQARHNLLHIRRLNDELNEMKALVENSLMPRVDRVQQQLEPESAALGECETEEPREVEEQREQATDVEQTTLWQLKGYGEQDG